MVTPLRENQNYKGLKRKSQEDGRKKHAITYENIEVHPGVPWVRREIIQQFEWHLVYDVDDIRLLGDPNKKNPKYSWVSVLHSHKVSYGREISTRFYLRFEVQYEKISGYWKVMDANSKYISRHLQNAAHADLCINGYKNILQVLEIMLNLRNSGEFSESTALLLEQDKKNIQKEFED